MNDNAVTIGNTEARNNACASGHVGGRAEEGRDDGGRVISKAQQFHARKKMLRRMPGHCTGCGDEWDGELRTCDKCRARLQHKRQSKRALPLSLHEGKIILADFGKRIAGLELAVANLSLANREAYRRGYRAGNRNVRLRLQRRIDYWQSQTVTPQEAATMRTRRTL